MGLVEEGFADMLTTTVQWAIRTGTDVHGNEEYADPVDLACFINSQGANFGQDDEGEQREDTVVTDMEILTDAVGVALRDKIIVDSKDLFVTAVDTPKDEVGGDLMHTITASTTEKG